VLQTANALPNHELFRSLIPDPAHPFPQAGGAGPPETVFVLPAFASNQRRRFLVAIDRARRCSQDALIRMVGWRASLPEPHFSPDRSEGIDKIVDIRVAVERGRCEAQPLGTTWHRGIVDRLDIDEEAIEQPITDLFTQHRIAHENRNNMARVVQMRNSGDIEPSAHESDAFVQAVTLVRTTLEMPDAGECCRRHSGGQGCRENETRCEASHEVAHRRGAGNLFPDDPEGLRQGASNHR
jgi:hypothetical protein